MQGKFLITPLSFLLLILVLGCGEIDQERPGEIDQDMLDDALRVAVVAGRAQDAGLLLRGGANVNAKYEYGRSALMIAVSRASVSGVRVLLENGADVDENDEHGRTVLMYAVQPQSLRNGENIEIFEMILGKHPDVNANNGFTALMGVVAGDMGDVIDGRLRSSETALYMARRLIEEGADVNAVDDRGCTALDYAGFPPLPQLLIDAGAKRGERCPGIIY